MTKEKMTKGQWLEINGFSEAGISYIVMGNSYAIKDQLKDAGFKFSPLLHWHGKSDELELPQECWYLEIEFNDFFTWDEEKGVAFLQEYTRERLDTIFNPPIESKSQHVGEIGDKITDVPCTISGVGGFNTAYGYRWVYTFTDNDENQYTWFSTNNKCLSTGMKILLSGKIKEHSEYRGVKTTVLVYCKTEVVDNEKV